MDCNATREAVEELEAEGELGCPLCDQPAFVHHTEGET